MNHLGITWDFIRCPTTNCTRYWSDFLGLDLQANDRQYTALLIAAETSFDYHSFHSFYFGPLTNRATMRLVGSFLKVSEKDITRLKDGGQGNESQIQLLLARNQPASFPSWGSETDTIH